MENNNLFVSEPHMRFETWLWCFLLQSMVLFLRVSENNPEKNLISSTLFPEENL
jgi:hypothetical protein